MDMFLEKWEELDEKLVIVMFSVYGFVGFVVVNGMFRAVDSLSFISDFFEFVGIFFLGFFVY